MLFGGHEAIGSGYNSTHSWYEVYTPWVNDYDDLQPVFDQVKSFGRPVWFEMQGCSFRDKPDRLNRVRLRFSNLDDALLTKLSIDV